MEELKGNDEPETGTTNAPLLPSVDDNENDDDVSDTICSVHLRLLLEQFYFANVDQLRKGYQRKNVTSKTF